MKVLHFYKTYFPDDVGGVQQVINQVIRGTENFGVSSEVLALSPSAVERTVVVDGHQVHRCRSLFEVASTPFSASAFLRFRELAKTADIIHYHFPYPFTDLLHLCCRIEKPSVVTYHSDIVKQKKLLKLYRPLQNKFLKSVDRIVATSPNYLKTSNVLKDFREKASVIPIGLDKDSYPATDNRRCDYWRDLFGERFFLFVGVLRYYKGLHILIEAAVNSIYPIVIVGAGPVEADLKSRVMELGLTNIHFLGAVDEEDKVALLNACYALIFPSHLRSEAFGISLLEGAMYGKPLISSEIGTGTTYINIHDETGLVVPPSDSSSLRSAMDFLWTNSQKGLQMGERAEARYWALFTADRMAESYYSLYQELLAEKQRY